MSLDGQNDEIANETEHEVEGQTFDKWSDGFPLLDPTVALASELLLAICISNEDDDERSDAGHDQGRENNKNEDAAPVHCTAMEQRENEEQNRKGKEKNDCDNGRCFLFSERTAKDVKI